jgi:hypothetical protein
LGGLTPVRNEMQEVAIKAHGATIVGAAEKHSTLSDCFEHGKNIGWRAADDVEHCTCRCLIFERFLQFLRPRLHLLEQSSVLDGDQGLIGEGSNQRDLVLSERLNDAVEEYDRTNDLAVPQQRNAENCAHSRNIRAGGVFVFRVCLNIWHMYRPPL